MKKFIALLALTSSLVLGMSTAVNANGLLYQMSRDQQTLYVYHTEHPAAGWRQAIVPGLFGTTPQRSNVCTIRPYSDGNVWVLRINDLGTFNGGTESIRVLQAIRFNNDATLSQGTYIEHQYGVPAGTPLNCSALLHEMTNTLFVAVAGFEPLLYSSYGSGFATTGGTNKGGKLYQGNFYIGLTDNTGGFSILPTFTPAFTPEQLQKPADLFLTNNFGAIQ